MQITDHVFVVTGASSGIGLSTAEALAARGAKVALIARNTEALTALSERLPDSLAVTADVTDFPAFTAAIGDIHRHYGRLDGLINNAGSMIARRGACVSVGSPLKVGGLPVTWHTASSMTSAVIRLG